VNVTAGASTDTDGVITIYQWNQVAGPSTAIIARPAAVSTEVSALVEGTYRFELIVTDDSGAVAKDSIDIIVLPKPTITSKFIKVNVYGGTNPYNTGGWNNWSIAAGEISNATSGTFNYDDNTAASASAVLSYAQGISDNGASYGGTMCPPQVLRYGSFSTSTRSLTIKGLNNSSKYDLEFYSSRANTGNSTQFTINGVNKTVVTDNNLANKVSYTDISPVNGQIVVTLSRVGTYNYLNGFMLTEKINQQSGQTSQRQLLTAQLPATDKAEISLAPNPFRSNIQLSLNSEMQGRVSVSVINISGKLVMRIEFDKTSKLFSRNVSLDELPVGIYVVRVQAGDKLYSQKAIKIK
jgi:Secretion system C-terminal sorting domain